MSNIYFLQECLHFKSPKIKKCDHTVFGLFVSLSKPQTLNETKMRWHALWTKAMSRSFIRMKVELDIIECDHIQATEFHKDILFFHEFIFRHSSVFIDQCMKKSINSEWDQHQCVFKKKKNSITLCQFKKHTIPISLDVKWHCLLWTCHRK